MKSPLAFLVLCLAIICFFSAPTSIAAREHDHEHEHERHHESSVHYEVHKHPLGFYDYYAYPYTTYSLYRK